MPLPRSEIILTYKPSVFLLIVYIPLAPSLRYRATEFSLNFTETPEAVSNQDDDDELRLVNDLFFSGYNKNVRPTKEKELPIEVKFGIAYTQIVDLVR